VTEFPVPTPSSSPEGIALGPDGALWFTEYLANKIGRISTDGDITEFPVPSAGNLEQIVAGPDGALWFTDVSGNQIGRITTDGAVTEFPLPTTSSQPIGIAAGPDGAIWFAEAEDRIGRITTDGVITEFSVAAGSIPIGLAAGPDGTIWFTEVGSNQIGRVTTTVMIGDCDTGVPNSPLPDGGTIESRIVACAAGADKHGGFARCVAHLTNTLKEAGLITAQQKKAIRSCAGPSPTPGPGSGP
jgi:virginiamycin B lyase